MVLSIIISSFNRSQHLYLTNNNPIEYFGAENKSRQHACRTHYRPTTINRKVRRQRANYSEYRLIYCLLRSRDVWLHSKVETPHALGKTMLLRL